MRFTKHTLAIAILEIYEKENRQLHRFNFLGGRGDGRGNLEYKLDIDFTDTERAFAGEIIKELEQRGLLMPTYKDAVNPGDWLVITDTGKVALRTGALDELDELLLGLDSASDLLLMRYGAYEAIVSQGSDWARHAATSCRELITKVLHTIAPDDEVRADPAFIPNTTSQHDITRKERIKFYLRKKQGSASHNDVNVAEKASALVEACYDKLNAVTHTDKREVENLIKLTENALIFLLK